MNGVTAGSPTVMLGRPRRASANSVAVCSALRTAPSDCPPRHATSSRSWYVAGTVSESPWFSTRRKTTTLSRGPSR